MAEDEFDFAGQNPGDLLTTDKSAQSFDYQARLHQKGYTKNSSPDAGELFKTLATEYVPTVVVNLPPKVVEKVKFVRRPGVIVRRCLLVLFMLATLTFNFIMSYHQIVDFALKTHLQPARCTVTSAHIDTFTDEGGNKTYSPVLSFVLHTPKGQTYRGTDNAPPTFVSLDDTQRYLSQHSMNHTYPCWYSPSNLDLTRFVNELIWPDYSYFVFSLFYFLVGFVLPVAMFTWILWMGFFSWRRRGST